MTGFFVLGLLLIGLGAAIYNSCCDCLWDAVASAGDRP